eukprot:m.247979 g.247979  ORF g.247979 m.247979 type:complete len:50 (+) comp26467_c0_seq4:477-626(+)
MGGDVTDVPGGCTGGRLMTGAPDDTTAPDDVRTVHEDESSESSENATDG